MAIQLQIRASFQNETKELLIEDITGIDALAGSSKWSAGGLNTNYTQADVDEVLLHVFVGMAASPKVVIATSLPATGFSFLPAAIEQTGEQFEDSVYHVRYMPFFLSFNSSVNIVNDNNTITVNSADKTVITSRGITLIKINGSIYEIDMTQTLAATSTSVVLKTKIVEATATVSAANVLVGYSADVYVLNDRKATDCLTKLMGSITVDDSCCKKCKATFINRFNDLNIARFNFNVALYSNSQEALEFVLRNCELSKSPCGC